MYQTWSCADHPVYYTVCADRTGCLPSCGAGQRACPWRHGSVSMTNETGKKPVATGLAVRRQCGLGSGAQCFVRFLAVSRDNYGLVLVHPVIQKVFKIPHHIEFYGTCMKH